MNKDLNYLLFLYDRCVKVNAFLKQQMGFKDVSSLKKGVIAYEKWVNDCSIDRSGKSNDRDGKILTSFFKGKNFIFDRRRLHDELEKQ